MTKLKIETKLKAADTLLQEYQVQTFLKDFFAQNLYCYQNDSNLFKSGKADEYQVICKDGVIGIHKYCLCNSEFYYKQCKARENYQDKGNGFKK